MSTKLLKTIYDKLVFFVFFARNIAFACLKNKKYDIMLVV